MRYVYTASHDLKAPITNSESITLAPCDTLPAEPQQNDVVARHHSAEEALVFNDLSAQISWPASWLPKFYKSFLLLLCLSLMTDYTHLIPANDPQRLAALQAYQLLGATPDAVFDELVRLVAQLFEVPIALISLVAKDTVEFTGNFGLPNVRVVARPDSVCSVAVLHNTTTMFEDLHADPCQLTNQLAAQQLNLGFYAGHPLHTRTGYNIGSLCVIDHQPRTLSALEQQRLATLADIVLELFDLRLAVLERPEVAQAMWDAIHRSIGTSLTRIDTLRSLGQWEESATTLAAQQYQRSIDDEAQLVIQALRAEVRAALRQVAAA